MLYTAINALRLVSGTLFLLEKKFLHIAGILLGQVPATMLSESCGQTWPAFFCQTATM